MKKIPLLLMPVCLALIAACASVPRFASVPPAEFKEAIARPGVQLVDVRTAEEHAAGCIGGSINIDVLQDSAFIPQAKRALTKRRPVAIYCRSGKRSKAAAALLNKAGYKVIELDGGYNAWRKANQAQP